MDLRALHLSFVFVVVGLANLYFYMLFLRKTHLLNLSNK